MLIYQRSLLSVIRWKRLFKEFFLADHSDDRNDDLLFFVQRADEAENGGLGVDPVFVKRKIKSQKKPLGHPQQEQHLQEKEQRLLTPAQEAVVLWKDTFFLNVIVQVSYSNNGPGRTGMSEPVGLSSHSIILFVRSFNAS